MIRSIITGTGSCIPEVVVANEAFENAEFFESDGARLIKSGKNVTETFQKVTGIRERRFAKHDQNASDLAFIAATNAISSSGIDKETLDYIIVAHNFGDVSYQSNRVSVVPSLASRVKALLKIENPSCVAYDICFGCPGWVEALIQANYYIRSGDAKRCLVIGTETLSRVCDSHDRDSMIYGDGSGAVILEAYNGSDKGILAFKTVTYALEESMLIGMAPSYSTECAQRKDLFLKMKGRKVYEFALSYVPTLVKEVLDKAGLTINDISKVLVHQANEKMDRAILERLFRLYDMEMESTEIMPMTIGWLGNNSVATVPTLLDLVLNHKLENQSIKPGDKVVMASVGAGMNINAIVYQF